MKKYIFISLILLLIVLLSANWVDIKLNLLIVQQDWEQALNFIEHRIENEKDNKKLSELIILREHMKFAMGKAAFVLAKYSHNNPDFVESVLYDRYISVYRKGKISVEENLEELKLCSQQKLKINVMVKFTKVDTKLEGFEKFSVKSAKKFFDKAVTGYFFSSLALEDESKVDLLNYIYLGGVYSNKGYKHLVDWINDTRMME